MEDNVIRFPTRKLRADGNPMGPEDCTICGCNRSACMNTACRGDGRIPNTPWQQAHPEWRYEGPAVSPL